MSKTVFVTDVDGMHPVVQAYDFVVLYVVHVKSKQVCKGHFVVLAEFVCQPCGSAYFLEKHVVAFANAVMKLCRNKRREGVTLLIKLEFDT